jgi:outer membrane protein OmpA-like peptidoglycan-associated protein
MSFNRETRMDIVHSIENSLSPSQINSLSRLLGESPDATERAITGAIPALLGGIAHQGETQQGAAMLIETMNGLPHNGALAEMIMAHDERLTRAGASVVNQLFNGQTAGITSLIGRFAGMKGGSVQNLLALSAPIVLGSIANEAPVGGFSPQGLMGLLDSQKPNIVRALPSGLSGLAGLIGLGGLAGLTRAKTAYAVAGNRMERTYDDAATYGGTAARTGTRWLQWLIGIVAIALLALFALRTLSGTHIPAPTLSTLTLPGGGTIAVRQGSIGDQLYRYLSSSTATTPQSFTFDNLEFDSAQGMYRASSQPTIDGIAAILKAYPAASVRVEGYTDSQGDDAANLGLSQARADSVAKALQSADVDASRVSAVGMGEAKPIADNGTEAGRAQNRRIELVVTQK